MKKAYLALIFLVINLFFVQAKTVSESTKISLLTGSPGNELYNTFGHSAIRVKDPAKGIDMVYNYGTFDFDTPNFYLNFTRGKLEYKLSIEPFESFKNGFIWENRSVVEQELNLTQDQKRILNNKLQENYKPENRYYKYDFFFDNCATRIRDIMITSFGQDFNYNYPNKWENDNLTFRNLIDLYLTDNHWSDFGIDIALGLPTDAIASPADYMFLPDYLAEGFETATIIRDGKIIPFTLESKLIVPRKDIEPDIFLVTPFRLMWSFFVLSVALSIFAYKKTLKIYWFDVLYFSIIGIVGWVVFLLWFFTDHIATKDNLNILWAVPIYFPLFLFWNKTTQKTRKWFMIIFGAINVIILLLWMVFPQNYHVAFIPLILIILMRFYILLIGIKKEPVQK